MKIRIQDIEFAYNGTPVLKNLEADIGKGDFLALVGPNGSGKSTLIKCINSILKPLKGYILVDDTLLQRLTPLQLAKKMAYVPQNSNKIPGIKVFDIVLTGRKPYINWKPSNEDINVTANVLRSLHLEQLAMKDMDKLSGGQQQAVYIARALAQEPDILLLDEPTANLDIKHQVEVLELLKGLSQKGITIILSLHDINMATRYADKIMMLKEGRIFAYGGDETITRKNIENLYDIKVRVYKDKDHVYFIPDGL